MKIAFITDELTTFIKDHDTSWVIMKEAHARGMEVYWATQDRLSIKSLSNASGPYGSFQFLDKSFFEFNPSSAELKSCAEGSKDLVKYPENYCENNPFGNIDLDDFNFIMMRKDPPVDLAYINATHILSLCEKAKVVNDPAALRDYNEKLSILQFPELITDTLVSRSKDEIKGFLSTHKKIVVKPLDGMGGEGIHVLEDFSSSELGSSELANREGKFNTVYKELSSKGSIMAQKYIPEIKTEGDKRIIVLGGKPLGAVMRIPKPGDHRANMAAGGSVAKHKLNARDLEICAALEKFLLDKGIYFAGIDVIGPYLTEINITSPTCIQEINRLDDLCGESRLESKLLDAISR